MFASFLNGHLRTFLQQQNNLASSSSISSHRYYDGSIHRSNEYGEHNKGHRVQGNTRYSGPGHKSPLSVGIQGQGM